MENFEDASVDAIGAYIRTQLPFVLIEITKNFSFGQNTCIFDMQNKFIQLIQKRNVAGIHYSQNIYLFMLIL